MRKFLFKIGIIIGLCGIVALVDIGAFSLMGLWAFVGVISYWALIHPYEKKWVPAAIYAGMALFQSLLALGSFLLLQPWATKLNIEVALTLFLHLPVICFIGMFVGKNLMDIIGEALPRVKKYFPGEIMIQVLGLVGVIIGFLIFIVGDSLIYPLFFY